MIGCVDGGEAAGTRAWGHWQLLRCSPAHCASISLTSWLTCSAPAGISRVLWLVLSTCQPACCIISGAEGICCGWSAVWWAFKLCIRCALHRVCPQSAPWHVCVLPPCAVLPSWSALCGGHLDRCWHTHSHHGGAAAGWQTSRPDPGTGVVPCQRRSASHQAGHLLGHRLGWA